MQYKAPPSKEMYILVGVPGSGKSSLARRLVDAAIYQNQSSRVCSADNYFTDSNGNYHFRQETIGKAHEYCQTVCLNALQNSTDIVIIDNTNTRQSERQIYIDMAKQFGYRVHILTVGTFGQQEIDACATRNVHGVPAEKVKAMSERILNSFTETVQKPN